MQQIEIYGVSFDIVGKQPIVLLKTVDGNPFLPIWIGHPEAAAILMKLQGAAKPRPMTHDLLSDVLVSSSPTRAGRRHRAARQHVPGHGSRSSRGTEPRSSSTRAPPTPSRSRCDAMRRSSLPMR